MVSVLIPVSASAEGFFVGANTRSQFLRDVGDTWLLMDQKRHLDRISLMRLIWTFSELMMIFYRGRRSFLMDIRRKDPMSTILNHG